MENIAISIASISTILSVVATIIGLVNGKSKNDKGLENRITNMEMKLETKVGEVAFTELSVKIDNLTKMVDRLNEDMHSILSDSNMNSNTISLNAQRIEALEEWKKTVDERLNNR